MIKKTIFIAFLFFVCYTFFVLNAPKWWYASQHQWQDNVIKAQEFIYNENDTIQNVIIGSSLSCRFITDSLPQTYNLSFGGQSIFDGLKILTHKSKLPKNIFIEMNVVLRPESKEFTKSLNSPILYYTRKYIFSLREDKQPIAVFGKIVLAALMKINSTFTVLNYEKKDTIEKKLINNNVLFSKMLALQIKNYSQEPSDEILDKSFEILRDYVKILEEKNVNVSFFEMPVNFKLENLPQAKVIRETFYKYFPVSKYNYVPLPNLFKVETTDGVHLNEFEAIKYTTYFKSINKNYFR
jgi:hypothetical protein